ncbi:MAG: tetratricopeptide repeat protein, partial [Nitrospinota bacterium]|nr:tetratricopeptide repeat protein [Nitrospinota bacterium]
MPKKKKGNKDGLAVSLGKQAVLLQASGRLEEAMDLRKKEQKICEELKNKDGLSTSLGNQANILYAWGRLEEAMQL